MWYVEYMTDGGWKPLRDLREPNKPTLFATHKQAEDAASKLKYHRIKNLDNDLNMLYNVHIN
jgi:hypothetical protein